MKSRKKDKKSPWKGAKVYPVRIYDKNGKLKKTISSGQLWKRVFGKGNSTWNRPKKQLSPRNDLRSIYNAYTDKE